MFKCGNALGVEITVSPRCRILLFAKSSETQFIQENSPRRENVCSVFTEGNVFNIISTHLISTRP